jgi:endoglucanase
LPVDEEQLWDEAGKKESEAFQLLHNAIGWCQKNLRVVVDLHILRSHHFNERETPVDRSEGPGEVLCPVPDLGGAEKYPVSLVAYGLMNEPVADDAERWNKLVDGLVRQVRQEEPHRKIVIGSNLWQSTGTFDQLRIPPGDRDIILSFHFYTPMLITHYKASWTDVGKYKGPVNYPGQIVNPEEVAKLERRSPDRQGNNGVYNREKLESLLAKPLELAKKLDLPLYCGERGALPTTPREMRMQWYRDMRASLEKHGIAWANWDYKGGFGILGRGGQLDKEFVKTLILLDR